MLSDPDYVPEEDVRIELYRINHEYKFTLSTFADLPFIKKVCKDRPTKLELRQGLERVFDAIAAHRNNTTHTLRNPASFATQTWMNALREMRLAAASLPESASSKSWASGKTERRDQCRAITKAGQQCPHAAKENGYCGTHQEYGQRVTESGKEAATQDAAAAERQREAAQQSMHNLRLGAVGETEADAARWQAAEGRDGAAQSDASAPHSTNTSSWAMKARSGAAQGLAPLPPPPVPVPQPVDSQHAHSQLCAHAAQGAYAQAAQGPGQGQGNADGAFEGEGDGRRGSGGGGESAGGGSLAPREWEEYPDVPVPKEWTEQADTPAVTPPPSAQKVSEETPKAAQSQDTGYSEGAEGAPSTASLDSQTMEVLSERRLEDLKVEELKKICRARGLAVSGTKAQLLNRLQGKPGGASTPPPDGSSGLNSMRTDELKDICRQAGSPVSGTKEQLADRVQEYNLRVAAKKAAESTLPSQSSVEAEDTASTAALPVVKTVRAVKEQDAAPRSSPPPASTPSVKGGLSSSSSMVGLDTHPSQASALSDQGKLGEVEGIQRQLVEQYSRLLGPLHADTLAAKSSLASTLRGQGRLGEAEGIQRQVVEQHSRVSGPEHPHTLTAMSCLAHTLFGQGKLGEAEAMERAVAELRSKGGPEQLHALNTKNKLPEMWTATANSSCPGINDGLVRVAAMSGGKLKTALEAKRAWHSGLQAFARVAADGPMITPEMTQVEKVYQSAMHEEACLAVDDMLRHGDPTRLRSYVTASRAVNHSGQSTEGAQINTLVVNYIRMMFTVAASGVGDGGDSSEQEAVLAMCSWMLGLVDDPTLQARASAFVRARVDQVAIRIADFF